jgi:hypothetical protein
MPMPRPMPRGGPGRYAPPPPPPDNGADQPGPAANVPPPPARFGPDGTLVLRVSPAGADVLIDGEHWNGPTRPDERLIIQLGSGHHVIEVHKDGYRDLRTEVDVRAGGTTPVNASLTPDR